MGDLFQNGTITTLHKLASRPLGEIENELLVFSQQRPMALVLPSLYSELSGPALSTILDQLYDVPYLEEIVIGLDRADREQFAHALKFFDKLPQRNRPIPSPMMPWIASPI